MVVEIANLNSRTLAYLTDSLIKSFYQILFILILSRTDIRYSKNNVIVIQYIVNNIIPLLLTFYYTAKFDATLGQQLLNIKIENDNIFVEKPSIKQHLIRIFVFDIILAHVEYFTLNSCFIVKCIPEILQIVLILFIVNDPKNKGFHDYLASTIVVNASSSCTTC